MNLPQPLRIAGQAFKDWREDQASRLGAALAYYAVFSLAPMLIIAIGVAGLIFGERAAQGELMAQLEGNLGPEAASALETMIASAGQGGSGLVATLVGIGMLLFGASGLFAQLQGAMNTIWEVGPAGGGAKRFVKKRLTSMGIVLFIGLLLLAFLALSAALSAMSDLVDPPLPGGVGLWQIVNQVASFAIMTALFAVLFKVLPDARVHWRDVWIGAAVTAVLFVIGKFLLGLYLGRSSMSSAYGAAGSLVVLLVWIYYSAQIFFYGAEYTQAWARRHGEAIQPQEGAVHIETVRRKAA